MTSEILFDTSFPHGTAEGYAKGCHGSHCPAEVSCATFHARYAGDFAFRKAINSGMTASEVVAWEQKQAQEAADAALAAKRALVRATHQERANEARRRKRADGAVKRSADGTPTTPLQVAVHALHEEGLTDTQIAEQLGKTRRHVRGVRAYLRLEPNTAPRQSGASSFHGDASAQGYGGGA